MSILKYMKSHWKVYDFGRGKNKTSKARHRRFLKKKSIREYLRDLKDLL